MPGALRAQAVEALFVRLGEMFVEGRLDEVAALHAFPCPVEVEGALTVMFNAAELEAFFTLQRAPLAARGLLAMTPHIAAVEIPRKGRFRAWLRWVMRFPDGVDAGGLWSIYYLVQDSEGRIAIEMMDISRLSTDASSA